MKRKTIVQEEMRVKICKEYRKQTELSPFLSVVTLNVKELKSPMKRQRLAKCTKIHDPTIYSFQIQRHKQTENEKIEKKTQSMKTVNNRKQE